MPQAKDSTKTPTIGFQIGEFKNKAMELRDARIRAKFLEENLKPYEKLFFELVSKIMLEAPNEELKRFMHCRRSGISMNHPAGEGQRFENVAEEIALNLIRLFKDPAGTQNIRILPEDEHYLEKIDTDLKDFMKTMFGVETSFKVVHSDWSVVFKLPENQA